MTNNFHTQQGRDKLFSHTGWGTNISYTQERGGTNISHTHEGGGTNIFDTQGGDKNFFVGGGGAYDDADEEMVVSEANYLVSEAN